MYVQCKREGESFYCRANTVVPAPHTYWLGISSDPPPATLWIDVQNNFVAYTGWCVHGLFGAGDNML